MSISEILFFDVRLSEITDVYRTSYDEHVDGFCDLHQG